MLNHGRMAPANVTKPNHRKSDDAVVHDAKLANYLRPMRVVSLVPSWTECLHDFDVNVVGQTKFCVRPASAFRSVPRVGGTKTVDVDSVLKLQPDLVVANMEENDKDQVEALIDQLPVHASVWVSDVRTVEQALEQMTILGMQCEKADLAQSFVSEIEELWGDPRAVVGQAGYAVWRSPWMVAGPNTFIHDVMRWWGIDNAFGQTNSGDRYPTLSPTDIDGIGLARTWLLPSEPFPFKDKHLTDFQDAHPEARFHLVDGEAFSWYGTRMKHVVKHLASIHEALSRE
jgi:hypothetical protein